MNLIRFEPLNHKNRYVSTVFDDVFNRNISDLVGRDVINNMPAVNIIEKEDGFLLEVAAPGLSKQDLKIATDKNRLTISAEQSGEQTIEEGKLRRREFNYNSFSRSFTLPNIVDKDTISAVYADGVLRVTLPKRAEILQMEKSRVIEVA